MIWATAATSTIVAAIIINPTIGVFLGFLLGLLTLGYFAVRNWARGIFCLVLAAIAGASVIAIFTINYLATGLINDQGILVFWRFADLERLYQWGALPFVIITHWATTGLVANSVPLSSDTIKFLLLSLRLDLLWPLVGIGVIVAGMAMIFRRARIPARNQVWVLAAAILVFVALALMAGRSQPISFFRYSSFIVPIVIAAGVALWTTPRLTATSIIARAGFGALPLIVFAACVASADATYSGGAFSLVVSNGLRFATGRYSIDTAYTTQIGWPGRLPWGAIYPGARGAYAIVGPHTPIWSMHVHSYCLLPNCRIESYPSFIMARDWDQLMFGAPEKGRAVLQAAGLNYFLFSSELARDLKLTDVLPRSPLFAPETIGRYLGIRWTDGKTTLLTWLGPNTKQIDDKWLADYRRAVRDSPTVQSYPYEAMKKIYARLRATPRPWKSFELPWEGNRPY